MKQTFSIYGADPQAWLDANWQAPWKTPIFNAQVKTSNEAQSLTGDFRRVTHEYPIYGQANLPAPFCLRTVRDRRTPETQAFRDYVAATVRRVRRTCR